MTIRIKYMKRWNGICVKCGNSMRTASPASDLIMTGCARLMTSTTAECGNCIMRCDNKGNLALRQMFIRNCSCRLTYVMLMILWIAILVCMIMFAPSDISV